MVLTFRVAKREFKARMNKTQRVYFERIRGDTWHVQINFMVSNISYITTSKRFNVYRRGNSRERLNLECEYHIMNGIMAIVCRIKN